MCGCWDKIITQICIFLNTPDTPSTEPGPAEYRTRYGRAVHKPIRFDWWASGGFRGGGAHPARAPPPLLRLEFIVWLLRIYCVAVEIKFWDLNLLCGCWDKLSLRFVFFWILQIPHQPNLDQQSTEHVMDVLFINQSDLIGEPVAVGGGGTPGRCPPPPFETLCGCWDKIWDLHLLCGCWDKIITQICIFLNTPDTPSTTFAMPRP